MNVSYLDAGFIILGYVVLIGIIVGLVVLGVALYRYLKRH